MKTNRYRGAIHDRIEPLNPDRAARQGERAHACGSEGLVGDILAGRVENEQNAGIEILFFQSRDRVELRGPRTTRCQDRSSSLLTT